VQIAYTQFAPTQFAPVQIRRRGFAARFAATWQQQQPACRALGQWLLRDQRFGQIVVEIRFFQGSGTLQG
jgi:hypothetical protein